MRIPSSSSSYSSSSSSSNDSSASTRTSRRTSRSTIRGFSLAEVLFALAITSFALLALIGVLPQGLQSLQNAQRQEAEARIVQHLAARYQMKAWNEFDQTMGGRDETNFDANGTFVEQESNDIVFRARADVMSGLPLPNETAASPFLRRLRVRITNQPNNGSALDTPSKYRERYVALVNCDKSPATANPAAPAGTGTTTGTTGPASNP